MPESNMMAGVPTSAISKEPRTGGYPQDGEDSFIADATGIATAANLDSCSVGARKVNLDKQSTPSFIDDLPNELLSNIFAFLDTPQPSASNLLDEPTFELTNSEVTDLKAISTVTKRWRQAVLPLLFKHARLIAADPEIQRIGLKDQIQPFLDFAGKNALGKVTTSLVLLVRYKNIINGFDGHEPDCFSGLWTSVFEAVDPVELLIIAPAEALGALTACEIFLGDALSFDSPCHYLRLLRTPANATNTPVEVTTTASNNLPTNSPTHEIVEPVTKTFAVDNVPEDLLSRPGAISSQNTPHHSSEPSTLLTAAIPKEPMETQRAERSTIFDIRPWSELLLNEGSFLKAYSSDEFWLRKPPSILPQLVGVVDVDAPPAQALISPTIRIMSYIGIFPMSSHFTGLTRHCPRLDHLYVQLVPRNGILDDANRMRKVDAEDLWMERNSCYALLMRELFNAPPLLNYKYLQIFESGDAADADAWHMAVEYVKRAGNGWQVARDGVFVREPLDLQPDGTVIAGSSTFQGALIRWAWNGTTKLPVSAYPLYGQPLGPVAWS